MPTPDPPTPTHSWMRGWASKLDGLEFNGCASELRAYIASAESTAAELLKARERIAELERCCPACHGTRKITYHRFTDGPTLNAIPTREIPCPTCTQPAAERIAELERENAELKEYKWKYEELCK